MKLPNPYTQRKLAEAIATGRSFRSRQEDHSASRRWNLFEQLSQILQHGVFFVRAHAIGEKELLAQVQCLSLHCSGIKPVPSLQRYQACPLSNPGIDLCTLDFLSRSVRYQSISHRI